MRRFTSYFNDFSFGNDRSRPGTGRVLPGRRVRSYRGGGTVETAIELPEGGKARRII